MVIKISRKNYCSEVDSTIWSETTTMNTKLNFDSYGDGKEVEEGSKCLFGMTYLMVINAYLIS